MATRHVIIDLSDEAETAAFSRWLERWSDKVKISEDTGCGCCVSIFDVEGPLEALSELPLTVVGTKRSETTI